MKNLNKDGRTNKKETTNIGKIKKNDLIMTKKRNLGKSKRKMNWPARKYLKLVL